MYFYVALLDLDNSSHNKVVRRKKGNKLLEVPDQITTNFGVTKFMPVSARPIMMLMRIFEGYFSATIPRHKLSLVPDDEAS